MIAVQADLLNADEVRKEQASNIAGLEGTNQQQALRIGDLKGSAAELQKLVETLKEEAAAAKVCLKCSVKYVLVGGKTAARCKA